MSAGDRRAQLIEAALDVFSRQGFRGATTREIAARAGVSEAVIFRHFPSKETLYMAVLDSRLDSPEQRRRRAELDALMEREDDEGIVRAILRNVCARYTGDPRFERVALFAALEGRESALRHLIERGDPYLRRIRKYIARRQKAGALIAGEPTRLLLAVNGIAHFYGAVSRIFRMPIPLPDDEAVDLFTRIAMHGLSNGRSRGNGRKARGRGTREYGRGNRD
jgi:TetR/AcrR family transcriptional regulator